MKRLFFFLCGLLLFTGLMAQTSSKLEKAYRQFELDSQLRHAVSSLYVIDAKTGKAVFDKNSQIGLAPASTQKVITSVTAFELLGKDFRYKTDLGYDGNIKDGVLHGNLYLLGTGDPTMGSWRWPSTKDTLLLERWLNDLRRKGIKSIDGTILFDWSRFTAGSIPDGWMWQDMGNYYGAGADVLNWHENQLDVKLKSGAEIGSAVEVVSPRIDFINELKAAKKGSGDNAYAYLPVGIRKPVISGTIPVSESAFTISIADADPIQRLIVDMGLFFKSHGIQVHPQQSHYSVLQGTKFDKKTTILGTYYSPSLDSIIYWFNKKSINLYGEALVKTFAYQQKGFGTTEVGVDILREFWKQKGLDEEELNMRDGSGLSPLNRVTTHAQVEILKYARTREWFPYFYNALPEYNSMKMKSGTISDVKGFCGYHKAADGNEYIFSFLVNNYSGSASALVKKMYVVLDVLK